MYYVPMNRDSGLHGVNVQNRVYRRPNERFTDECPQEGQNEKRLFCHGVGRDFLHKENRLSGGQRKSD